MLESITVRLSFDELTMLYAFAVADGRLEPLPALPADLLVLAVAIRERVWYQPERDPRLALQEAPDWLRAIQQARE